MISKSRIKPATLPKMIASNLSETPVGVGVGAGCGKTSDPVVLAVELSSEEFSAFCAK